MCLLGYYVVQERRDCILNSIVCFVFGVKEVGGIVDAPSQSILEFVEAQQLLHISPNYGFIWQQLQNFALMLGHLPLQIKEHAWID